METINTTSEKKTADIHKRIQLGEFFEASILQLSRFVEMELKKFKDLKEALEFTKKGINVKQSWDLLDHKGREVDIYEDPYHQLVWVDQAIFCLKSLSNELTNLHKVESDLFSQKVIKVDEIPKVENKPSSLDSLLKPFTNLSQTALEFFSQKETKTDEKSKAEDKQPQVSQNPEPPKVRQTYFFRDRSSEVNQSNNDNESRQKMASLILILLEYSDRFSFVEKSCINLYPYLKNLLTFCSSYLQGYTKQIQMDGEREKLLMSNLQKNLGIDRKSVLSILSTQFSLTKAYQAFAEFLGSSNYFIQLFLQYLEAEENKNLNEVIIIIKRIDEIKIKFTQETSGSVKLKIAEDLGKEIAKYNAALQNAAEISGVDIETVKKALDEVLQGKPRMIKLWAYHYCKDKQKVGEFSNIILRATDFEVLNVEVTAMRSNTEIHEFAIPFTKFLQNLMNGKLDREKCVPDSLWPAFNAMNILFDICGKTNTSPQFLKNLQDLDLSSDSALQGLKGHAGFYQENLIQIRKELLESREAFAGKTLVQCLPVLPFNKMFKVEDKTLQNLQKAFENVTNSTLEVIKIFDQVIKSIDEKIEKLSLSSEGGCDAKQ